jgi:hypothetical protein
MEFKWRERRKSEGKEKRERRVKVIENEEEKGCMEGEREE